MAPPGRHGLGRFTSTQAAAVTAEKITRTGERTTDVRHAGGLMVLTDFLYRQICEAVSRALDLRVLALAYN